MSFSAPPRRPTSGASTAHHPRPGAARPRPAGPRHRWRRHPGSFPARMPPPGRGRPAASGTTAPRPPGRGRRRCSPSSGWTPGRPIPAPRRSWTGSTPTTGSAPWTRSPRPAPGRAFALQTGLGRTGEARAVVLVGEPELDAAGRGGRGRGHVRRHHRRAPRRVGRPNGTRALEAEVGQLRAAMASRAVIEQAKGILMLLTSCGDQTAFDLLAPHLQPHPPQGPRRRARASPSRRRVAPGCPTTIRAIIRDACPPDPAGLTADAAARALARSASAAVRENAGPPAGTPAGGAASPRRGSAACST